MESKTTYKPFDKLLKSTGMTFTSIAKKADMEDYTLYRLRQRPSKLNGETIVKISDATGLNEIKLFEISYFFAQKVDILQQN